MRFLVPLILGLSVSAVACSKADAPSADPAAVVPATPPPSKNPAAQGTAKPQPGPKQGVPGSAPQVVAGSKPAGKPGGGSVSNEGTPTTTAFKDHIPHVNTSPLKGSATR
jgi:hypothetical protein